MKEPIRNINSFIGLLERSLKGKLNKEQKDYMGFVSRNTVQMQQLIEDVLEYSRLSDDSRKNTTLDLNEIIRNIKYSMENTLKNRNAEIRIKQSLPIIKNHPTRIHLLFKNLIENGIKYNEKDKPEVVVDYEENMNEHIFSISDNGIGIGGEYLDSIFEMFKRLHSREKYEGTGLGLSLSKKIVTNLGGRIWVESEEGKGSTFCFTIPIIGDA